MDFVPHLTNVNWSAGLKSFHFELPCLEKKGLDDVGF